uniref:Nose resistant-to-fluoxetine protein N-terminal domain-containing protein n=1 Tax=Setaria digitata TaxID=48799 RepID=A0A915PRG6_9BILA
MIRDSSTKILIWLSNIELNKLLSDIDKLNITKDCKDDLKLTVRTARDFLNENELSDWQKSYLQNALLPMIDASAKFPPSGILRGHVTVYGQYDECMLVRQQLPNSKRSITGSYVRIFIDKNLRSYDAKDACKLHQYGTGDPSFDICIPSSCDHYQTLITLSRSLIRYNDSTPVCTVKQASVRFRPIDYKTWIVTAVIGVIVLIALLATIWDLQSIYCDSKYDRLKIEETACWFRCFMAFSVIQNTKDIFKISSNNSNKLGQIGPIHFMRFVSMVWVIYGHATAGYMLFSSNILDSKEAFKNLTTQFMANAFFSVDTFFFMSGLLVSYVWFKEYRRDWKKAMSPITWLMFYIHRLIRLSPPYYIVIAFYSFVFKSLLVHTPLILTTVHENCEQSWWINYLYINNYIDHSNQCYLISWYLATDFQLHIFTPLLLIPLALKPILGYVIIGLILSFSTVANLITVYKEYFPPTDFFAGAMDPRMGSFNRYSLLIYQAPWIRCQSYIIGILTGYLFQTVKKLHIPKLINIFCWIASILSGVLLIVSLRDWIGYDIVMDLSLRAIYSAFSKLLWCTAVAYIVIACFYGYGGPINDLMSLSVWKPLGRLSYCTYLVHLTVIIFLLCIGVNAFSFSSITHTFFIFTLPCCILSWFFAYWLSILFELPASKIELILFGRTNHKIYEADPRQEIQPTEEQLHPVINCWKKSTKIEVKKDDQKKGQRNANTDVIQTPIEMSSPVPESEGRGAFRKLFMKLGEKVGTVKISELSQEYLDRAKETDAYKEILCKLSESIMHVMQQNPKLVPEAESKMEFDCPPNQDPMELLAISLGAMRENFSTHIAALETCIDTCTKLATLHRSYRKRGRRALHFIRTFINVDYELVKRREEMDFARHEYANNPTEPKKESCDKAVAKFNEQSEEVFKALGTIQFKKEKHRLELIKVLDEMRKYHTNAATECFRVCKAKW